MFSIWVFCTVLLITEESGIIIIWIILPSSHVNEAKQKHPTPSRQTTTSSPHRMTQSKQSTTALDFHYGMPRSYPDTVIVHVCWSYYSIAHPMQESWDSIDVCWGCRKLSSWWGIGDRLHRVLCVVLRFRLRFGWGQEGFVVRWVWGGEWVLLRDYLEAVLLTMVRSHHHRYYEVVG